MSPLERLRKPALFVVLLGAAAWVTWLFTADRPLSTWWLPRYAPVWAATLLFTASSYAAGLRALDWLWPQAHPREGRRVLAFACGVLLFFWAAFLCGIAGALGPLFFFAVPALGLLLGADALAREARLLVDRFARPVQFGWFHLGIAVAAACVFGLVYLPILSPENLNYDARWYHLGLAEHYTAAGRIARIPEGFLNATFPQLTTVLDTWAFALPGASLFERVELCLHLEGMLVVATVGAIPTLARALVPGVSRFSGAWLVYFLFPGIFIYDTAIEGGADHTAAFWVVPAWLALLAGWKRFGWRESVLLAVPLSGLLLTKYSAVVAVAPIAVALCVRSLILLGRAVRRRSGARILRTLREPLPLLGAGLVLTSAHWLKNLIFYRDPIYPVLRHWLGADPWTPEAERWHEFYLLGGEQAQGSRLYNLRQALEALFDHSFASYSWPDMHHAEPAFGSLFTACVIALPFLAGTRRVWALTGAVLGGIFSWYYLAHLERYLQVVVPWMAVVVAVVLVLAVRQGGKWVALGAVALVLAQLVGQMDLPFLPNHRVNGRRSALEPTVIRLGSGYRGDTEQSLHVLAEWEELGALTPLEAKVLVHVDALRLGIGRQTVTDRILGPTYGISYGRLGSVGAIHQQLKSFGVTHLAWPDDAEDADSLAGELLFRTYARLHSVRPQTLHGITLARLPDAAPAHPLEQVLLVGCGQPYQTGLYTLEQLKAPRPQTHFPEQQFLPFKRSDDLQSLVSEAQAVVLERACTQRLDLEGFESLGFRRLPRGLDLWVRR